MSLFVRPFCPVCNPKIINLTDSYQVNVMPKKQSSSSILQMMSAHPSTIEKNIIFRHELMCITFYCIFCTSVLINAQHVFTLWTSFHALGIHRMDRLLYYYAHLQFPNIYNVSSHISTWQSRIIYRCYCCCIEIIHWK